MANAKFYGTGRRKKSIARVYLVPGTGKAVSYTHLVLIGLFALSQILEEAEAGMKRNPKMEGGIKGGGRKFSFSDFKGQGVNTIRSAAIGTFMGILPGVGGSAASLLSYSQAKNFSKHPDEFGKGCVDGLVASEACLLYTSRCV